jgi:NAD(P)H dehydrogenase (quinone)
VLKNVAETKLEDLTGSDGIIIGSPTYYSQMAAEIKGLFDISSEIRGRRWRIRSEQPSTSSASIEGGNQTTLISIIQALLIHSMVVVGDPMATGGPLWAHSRGRAQTRLCP